MGGKHTCWVHSLVDNHVLLLMHKIFLWNRHLVDGVIIENRCKINIEMASKGHFSIDIPFCGKVRLQQWHELGAAQACTHTPHTHTTVHDTNSKVLPEASKNIRRIN